VTGLNPQDVFVIYDSGHNPTTAVTVVAKDLGQGHYQAVLTSTTPGDYLAMYSCGVVPLCSTPFSFTIAPTPSPTPTPPPPPGRQLTAQLSLSSSALVLVTGGCSTYSTSSTASVVVKDANGAPAANVPVTFSVDSASVLGVPATPVLTNAQGVATATLTTTGNPTNAPLTAHVSATIPGPSGAPTAATGSPAAIDVSTLENAMPLPPHFDVAPTNGGSQVYADGTDSWTGTAVVWNGCGTPPPDSVAADLSFDVSPGVQVSGMTRVSPGVFTVKFTSTTVLPNATATALYQGQILGVGLRPIPFVAPPSTLVATLSVSSTVIALNCGTTTSATASVAVRDGMGKPVQGVEVTFSLDGSVLQKVTSNVQGLASTTIVSAGVLHATIQVSGSAVDAIGSPVTFTMATARCPAVTVTITQPTAGSVVATGTPRITGTSEPGNVVTVREGSTDLCTAIADSSGIWSCAPATPLADGPHVLVATATHDLFAPASAQVALTVETGVPPTVAVVVPTVYRGGTQTIGGSGWYPGESVHLTVQSTPLDLGTVFANADGTLPVTNFKVPAGFEIGTHTVTAVGSVSGIHLATFEVKASSGGGGSSSGTKHVVGTGGSVAGDTPWAVWLAAAAWAAGLIVLASRRKARQRG